MWHNINECNAEFLGTPILAVSITPALLACPQLCVCVSASLLISCSLSHQHSQKSMHWVTGCWAQPRKSHCKQSLCHREDFSHVSPNPQTTEDKQNTCSYTLTLIHSRKHQKPALWILQIQAGTLFIQKGSSSTLLAKWCLSHKCM